MVIKSHNNRDNHAILHAQSLNLEIGPAKKGVICNLIVFFFFFKTTISGQLASLFYGIISEFNKKGV